MTTSNALGVLLLQITVILVVATLTAAAVSRAGQPAVVGEMLGGILLGPSFFGWLIPAAHRAIFLTTRSARCSWSVRSASSCSCFSWAASSIWRASRATRGRRSW